MKKKAKTNAKIVFKLKISETLSGVDFALNYENFNMYLNNIDLCCP